jgi:hypothetical protein
VGVAPGDEGERGGSLERDVARRVDAGERRPGRAHLFGEGRLRALLSLLSLLSLCVRTPAEALGGYR